MFILVICPFSSGIVAGVDFYFISSSKFIYGIPLLKRGPSLLAFIGFSKGRPKRYEVVGSDIT